MHEQLLTVKARHSKRDRDAHMQQERNAFLERVNADLHARLEAYEAEEAHRQSAADREVCALCDDAVAVHARAALAGVHGGKPGLVCMLWIEHGSWSVRVTAA